MTVYPLPEPINDGKKEKLLDGIFVPTAGSTPGSVAVATSFHNQRSFRLLIIGLMVLGLLIIGAVLAYIINEDFLKPTPTPTSHVAKEQGVPSTFSHFQSGTVSGSLSFNFYQNEVKEDVKISATFIKITSHSFTYHNKQYNPADVIIIGSTVFVCDNKIYRCYFNLSQISFNPNEFNFNSVEPVDQLVEASYVAKRCDQTEVEKHIPHEIRSDFEYFSVQQTSNKRQKRGANCVVKRYDAGFFPIGHKNTLYLDEIHICE